GAALPDSGPFSPPRSGFGTPGIDPATGGGSVTTGPMRLTGNDDVSRFSFSTSLRDITRFAAAAKASKTEPGAGLAAGQGLLAAARFNPFDIWVVAKYTNFRDNSIINGASNAMDGQFGLLSVGADYVLSRWLLVGVMAQFDIMTQTSHTQGTEASGR